MTHRLDALVQWLAAARPGFLVVTLATVVLGIAIAPACGVRLDAPAAAATLLLALLTHAAINLYNDYGDARGGSDALNTGRIEPFTGGSRAIQRGIFTAEQVRDVAYGLGIVVVAGGLILGARAGPGLLVIGLAGLALGWAYSSPRVALMSRGWGELAVALGWWLVVVGADVVQRHHFSAIAAIAGVSPALLIAAVLGIAEFPDANADAAVGKRTLVVRLGARPAAWAWTALVLGAHGWLAWWWWIDWLPTRAVWALATLPPALAAAVLLHRRVAQPATLRPAIVLTLLVAVVHPLALGAAFLAVAGLR